MSEPSYNQIKYQPTQKSNIPTGNLIDLLGDDPPENLNKGISIF